jgi:hypothetical protein
LKVFNYDEQGYFLGVSELDESDKCQITGNWLIPGNSTDKEPLETKEGFEVKFLENEWQYIKLLSIEEKKIKGDLPLEEGEKIIDGTLVKVESLGDLYSWNGSEWYLDDEKVRISKLPSNEELEKNRIEMVVLTLMTELEMI